MTQTRPRPIALALAGVLVGCATTAAAWLIAHPTDIDSHSRDCATVKATAQQWTSTVASIQHDLETGPGERADLLAAADREAAMAAQLRAAASHVSAPALQQQFTSWAHGVELAAQVQHRTATDPPTPVGAPDPSAGDQKRAAVMIYEASSRLFAACPDARPAGHP
ncbi:hypothetical protein [Mycobacterium avium]|uniref:hypothetical protein n=1 Tax=Mycobacterium avium TaxID=1764 RepID=UPI00115598A8|nr:hypothetical protein [Mycobacterium avium]